MSKSDERMETESKIVFIDGDRERAIRGIVEDDGHFIIVRRRDGVLKIARDRVVKVEQWNGRECSDGEGR